jgi:hypothetical protein
VDSSNLSGTKVLHGRVLTTYKLILTSYKRVSTTYLPMVTSPIVRTSHGGIKIYYIQSIIHIILLLLFYLYYFYTFTFYILFMVRNKLCVPAKVHNAVRTALLKGKKITKRLKVIIKKEHKFKKDRILNKYINSIYDPARKISFKYCNKYKGLGVFAEENIFPGIKLKQLWGKKGQQVKRGGLSVVQLAGKKHHSRLYLYKLLGTISFINHACEEHSNCISCLPNSRKKDWTFVQVKPFIRIMKGEEITLFYGANFNYLCEKCKIK